MGRIQIETYSNPKKYSLASPSSITVHSQHKQTSISKVKNIIIHPNSIYACERFLLIPQAIVHSYLCTTYFSTYLFIFSEKKLLQLRLKNPPRTRSMNYQPDTEDTKFYYFAVFIPCNMCSNFVNNCYRKTRCHGQLSLISMFQPKTIYQTSVWMNYYQFTSIEVNHNSDKHFKLSVSVI